MYLQHYILHIICYTLYHSLLIYYIIFYLQLVKECLGNCFTHGKLFSLVMHEQANILVIRLPQVRKVNARKVKFFPKEMTLHVKSSTPETVYKEAQLLVQKSALAPCLNITLEKLLLYKLYRKELLNSRKRSYFKLRKTKTKELCSVRQKKNKLNLN